MADQIVTDAKNVGKDIKEEGSKVWAWLKNKWEHIPTWGGVAYVLALVKHWL